MSDRVGVVLLHRGEPSTPAEANAWLKQAYADPHAYHLSFGSEAQRALAWPLAWWDAKGLAKRLTEIGGQSAVAAQVSALAVSLERKLNGDGPAKFKVLPGLRYAPPSIAHACRALHADGIQRLVGVSLYPQQCKRFFESSGRALSREAAPEAQVSIIDRCVHARYFDAVRASVSAALGRTPTASVLFVAMPLDRSDATAGDPYPEQLARTVAAVTSTLERPHGLAYLEAGGPGPSAEDALKELRAGGASAVVLCPLGTSVDELDVLQGIELRLRPFARGLGFTDVERAASVCDSPLYLEALVETIREHLTWIGGLGFVG